MAPEIDSADWSTSYSNYLARSAAISARTLHLYQLTLERISQGKLPPTIFQDYLPTFAATHATAFSKRLSEVASQFLSDLVRLGSSFAQQANSTAPEPEIAPPRFDPSNPARWSEELAEYAGQLNARALKAYRSQLDRVATGEVTPSEVQKDATEQLSRKVPAFLQLMTHAYFNLLNGLNEVRSAYEEAYFQGLLGAANGEANDAPVVLTLAGPSGATATASLAVTNTTGQRTRVQHHVFDVRRVDGIGPSQIPQIAFAPETLELEPDEEGTLSLSLQLDPGAYQADALYAGKLHLAGASEIPLEVELRIVASAGTTARVNPSQST